jgi:hypothetical protein
MGKLREMATVTERERYVNRILRPVPKSRRSAA